MAAGQSAPSELLMAWQGNVVNLWSDTARGAGFVLDRRGLILTNARVAGALEAVEVQFTATRKVAGRVLSADYSKNVAVIWIDPSLVSALGPAKLGTRTTHPRSPRGRTFSRSIASVLDQKTLASGRLTRVDTAAIETDIRLDDNALAYRSWQPAERSSALRLGTTVAAETRCGSTRPRR